jgi:hypothetical protein
MLRSASSLVATLLGLAFATAAFAAPATIPSSIWSSEDSFVFKLTGNAINERERVDGTLWLVFGEITASAANTAAGATILETDLAANEMAVVFDTLETGPVTFLGTYSVMSGQPVVTFNDDGALEGEVETKAMEIVDVIAGDLVEGIDYTLDLTRFTLESNTRNRRGVERFAPFLKLKFDAAAEGIDLEAQIKFEGVGLKLVN